MNDDVYGKILKSHSNLKPQTEYAEVFEACEGLGIILLFFSSDKDGPNALCDIDSLICLYN